MVLIVCLAAVGVAGYAVYKYRIRVCLLFSCLTKRKEEKEYTVIHCFLKLFLVFVLWAAIHGFRDTSNYGTIHALGQPSRNPDPCFPWKYLGPLSPEKPNKTRSDQNEFLHYLFLILSTHGLFVISLVSVCNCGVVAD